MTPKRKPGRPKGTGQGLEKHSALLTPADWRVIRRAAKEARISEAAMLRELVQAGLVARGLAPRTIGNPAAHPDTNLQAPVDSSRKQAEEDTRTHA